MSDRHRGYVSGSRIAPGGHTVWLVRVRGPTSPLHREPYIVASIRGDITLARGLNVDFALGTVDDPQGQPVPRAVDVALEAPTSGHIGHLQHSSEN